MKDITKVFADNYRPFKALVFIKNKVRNNEVFVEAYDMNLHGEAINAHPLSLNETRYLARCINASNELQSKYLVSSGLLPENILYLKQDNNGYVIWHTNEGKVNLLFYKELGIPSGKANVPKLVWKASSRELKVYAVKDNVKLNLDTGLCYPPFFNIQENDRVCMGTVNIQVEKSTCLEEFISKWEAYFWNSYFSHLIGNQSPVEGNIVQLWKSLINTDKPFPTEVLKENGKTIKDLIV